MDERRDLVGWLGDAQAFRCRQTRAEVGRLGGRVIWRGGLGTAIVNASTVVSDALGSKYPTHHHETEHQDNSEGEREEIEVPVDASAHGRAESPYEPGH